MKNKVSFTLLKYYVYKLRRNYQLPYMLVYYIDQLNNDSDIKLVTYLSELTKHYLRIKGYYKSFPLIEKGYNVEIEKLVREFTDNLTRNA